MISETQATGNYRLRKGPEGLILQRMFLRVTQGIVAAPELGGPDKRTTVQEVWEDVPTVEES